MSGPAMDGEMPPQMSEELPVAPSTTTPFTAGPAVSRTKPGSRAVRVTPLGGRRVDDVTRRRTSRLAWYAAAVATAGLAGMAWFAFGLQSQVGTMETELREQLTLRARLQARLREKERTLATLFAGRGNVVLVTLDAAVPTGPGMQIFWNVRDGKAVLHAYGLVPLASDRGYMLWMLRDGMLVPVKLFSADAGGRAIVDDVPLPTSTAGVTLFAVTEESAQGAAVPTLLPFLSGEVPAAR